ncbi:MAG: hypothetical protein K0S04_3205 [Herbinix sp.]|jgi:hypothetical protein|nr:hypothetical protein [Herbinix sp.]
MNKRLKKALLESFTAPPPIRKTQFLRTLRFPKTTYRDFILSQFFYIRKRVWVVSVFIVLLACMTGLLSPASINWNADVDKIWCISAVLPILALITITEIYRCTANRMAELEASCRFNLIQIIMARITVLGGGNFVTILLLLIIMNEISAYNILQIIAFMMVPYLLVCGICLWILNHVRGQEAVFGCSAATGLICAGSILFGSMASGFYTSASMCGWLVLLAANCIMIGFQVNKLWKHMEDGTWNLFLTE